jgi:uncharacterized protein (DUF4415 family)
MKKKTSEKHSGTDWAFLASDEDQKIDYSDIPKLDADFWRTAQLRMPGKKDSVTLRLDKDILAWFRASGRGYQTRINAILRSYVEVASAAPAAHAAVRER